MNNLNMRRINMIHFFDTLGAAACGAVLLLGAASCAKENTTTSNDTEKTYIESWLKVRNLPVNPTERGIYITEETPGSGTAYNGEMYAYVEYTAKDLEGTITLTTDEKTAQRIGSFSFSTYYGPRIVQISEESATAGLEDLLTGMQTGGTRTAVIPSWLQVYKRYKKNDEYYKHTAKNTSTVMYTLKMLDFTDDIDAWEGRQLDRFAKRNWGIDSTGFGLYYKQLVPPKGTADFPSDTTVYINYTGRLMNGKVFDTTIADTAKFHNIYSSSRTYGPVQINWHQTQADITMGTDNNEPVEGFKWLLHRMGRYEKGIGAFISKYGYTYKGGGSAIPPYTPILFEVELVDEP